MDKVANLPKENRNDLFSETARQMQTTNAIVEKNFWVVWILDKLFSDTRLNKILMFKGGASLSKVFDMIGRFSEDIDLRAARRCRRLQAKILQLCLSKV